MNKTHHESTPPNFELLKCETFGDLVVALFPSCIIYSGKSFNSFFKKHATGREHMVHLNAFDCITRAYEKEEDMQRKKLALSQQGVSSPSRPNQTRLDVQPKGFSVVSEVLHKIQYFTSIDNVSCVVVTMDLPTQRIGSYGFLQPRTAVAAPWWSIESRKRDFVTDMRTPCASAWEQIKYIGGCSFRVMNSFLFESICKHLESPEFSVMSKKNNPESKIMSDHSALLSDMIYNQEQFESFFQGAFDSSSGENHTPNSPSATMKGKNEQSPKRATTRVSRTIIIDGGLELHNALDEDKEPVYLSRKFEWNINFDLNGCKRSNCFVKPSLIGDAPLSIVYHIANHKNRDHLVMCLDADHLKMILLNYAWLVAPNTTDTQDTNQQDEQDAPSQIYCVLKGRHFVSARAKSDTNDDKITVVHVNALYSQIISFMKSRFSVEGQSAIALFVVLCNLKAQRYQLTCLHGFCTLGRAFCTALQTPSLVRGMVVSQDSCQPISPYDKVKCNRVRIRWPKFELLVKKVHVDMFSDPSLTQWVDHKTITARIAKIISMYKSKAQQGNAHSAMDIKSQYDALCVIAGACFAGQDQSASTIEDVPLVLPVHALHMEYVLTYWSSAARVRMVKENWKFAFPCDLVSRSGAPVWGYEAMQDCAHHFIVKM